MRVTEVIETPLPSPIRWNPRDSRRMKRLGSPGRILQVSGRGRRPLETCLFTAKAGTDNRLHWGTGSGQVHSDQHDPALLRCH